MSQDNSKEEFANTLTHALGMILSVVGLFCLLLKSTMPPDGIAFDTFQVVSFAIFGLSLLALYTASTLYHASHQELKKNKYKMWDHCAIYLLIAGTYTPFLLVSMRDTVGWLFFGIIWAIAIFGILLKVMFKHRFHLLRVATYLVMGWLVVLTWGDLTSALPEAGLHLLIAGGLVYTVGVVFYLYERMPYSHAIWHMFVFGGSFCHFLSIYMYVSP